MVPRVYAPDANWSGASIDLPKEEAVHLRRVLRLRDGDAVRVFDGRGREFDGHVARAGRAGVRVRLSAERPPLAEPRVRLTLAVAVLKGDAMDAVVRDAVMLGVVAVQPVLTDRSQTTVAAVGRGRRPERWRRVAIASAKQCGRATVPEIRTVVDPGAVVVSLGDGELPVPAFLLAEPSALLAAAPISAVAAGAPAAATVLTGPEGGWTPMELDQLSAVAQAITLGRLTLRAEVAPAVALSSLLTRWNAF
jgi:16S rRNA (uracil1498-N3)-methyltransferase